MSPANAPPAADAEALASSYLRAASAVTGLVGDRIYSTIPKRAEWPLVRITRIGGIPPMTPPVLDLARLQIDVFGGRKAEARNIAAVILAELAALNGPQAGHSATVSAVRIGGLRYTPDVTFDPPKPRYIATAAIYTRTM